MWKEDRITKNDNENIEMEKNEMLEIEDTGKYTIKEDNKKKRTILI